MRLLIALLLALAISSAYAAEGNCKEFIVWNPTMNDTLFHKNGGQEDAIPLGRHRNAHENILGTLYFVIMRKLLDLQFEMF